MKNKKITILLEGVKRIQEQLKETSQQPYLTDSTIKISFQNNESIVTVTGLEIRKLQKIFPHIHINQFIQDFEEYMTLPSQILGKRSSKILLSKSSKYCLKIVQDDDVNQIQTIFESLLHKFDSKNKNNCLIDIYFIFMVDYTISGVKMADRYIIMPNIRANFDDCIKAFDIKGHLEARAINHEDFIDFKFGKDENFVQSEELNLLRKNLSPLKRKQFIDQIRENIDFLSKNGIIDYSLMFSFEKQTEKTHEKQYNSQQYPCPHLRIDPQSILKFVIIDYFQIYNEKKKLENRFKSIFRKSCSSVEPQVYSKRLYMFLEKHLLS